MEKIDDEPRDSVDHVHAQVGEGRDIRRLWTVREHRS
jgi:hypothetical protein